MLARAGRLCCTVRVPVRTLPRPRTPELSTPVAAAADAFARGRGPSFTALKGQLCSHCGRVGVCRAVLRRGLAHPRQTRLHHRGGHRRAPPAERGASGTAVEKRGDTFGWGGRLWAVGLAVLQLGGGASAAAGRGGSAAAGREGVGRCDRMTVGFLGREDRRRR